MKWMNVLRKLRLPAALILVAVISAACLGCAVSDVSDVLDLAGDVLELIDEAENAAGTVDSMKADAPPESPIDEDGSYFSKDEVALYIHTYGDLPDNFITKSEAEKLGWESGSVQKYAPGCAIGGDVFGNLEGLLPKKDGRTYRECDIDTDGMDSRGAKRIVFSSDGLIYYTDDHYESFTLLYGEE